MVLTVLGDCLNINNHRERKGCEDLFHTVADISLFRINVMG